MDSALPVLSADAGERLPRECDCSLVGLIRCVHFDGQAVQLIKGVAKGLTWDIWHVCSTTKCQSTVWYDTEVAALEAFNNAAAALVAGE